jgi:hypothetical protein
MKIDRSARSLLILLYHHLNRRPSEFLSLRMRKLGPSADGLLEIRQMPDPSFSSTRDEPPLLSPPLIP